MIKRLLSLALVLVLLVTMCPVTARAQEAAPTVTLAGSEMYSLAGEVVERINTARAGENLPALIRSATLSDLAMQRAAEIALFYESHHNRPDDSTCFTVLDGVYFGYTACGENIAIGQRSAEDVMAAWLNSTGHRANIMNRDYTQVGVGCFYADGVYAWVQIFGNSATDTAVTDASGSAAVNRTIPVNPENLDLSSSGPESATLDPGGYLTFEITNLNAGFPYIYPVLVPTCSGTDVASVEIAQDGEVTVTALTPGTVTLSFPVYDGQPDPYTLELTVTGQPEETTEPETTEPEPSEPTPSEPEPSVPTPSEPEPSEPEPSEPVESGIIAQGTCGETVYWKLDEDGLLTIWGEGPMYNGYSTDVPWYQWRDQIYAAVVESGVTTIRDYAFFCYPNITSLEIADTVTKLGYRMCEGSEKLSHVSLPAGITEISFFAFGRTALTEVVIPDGVTAIDNYAFYSCKDLVKLVIPESTTSIASDATDYCPNLTIWCYVNTKAHLYARAEDIPVVLMEERPGTVSYPIVVYSNDGGSVTINAESSPAGRYVDLEVIPSEGYHLSSLYYFLGSPHAGDLDFEIINDSIIRFLMPECAVGFDITFVVSQSPFVDTDPNGFYYYPVLWAVSSGITSGTDATHFSPNNACTRGQVVTFLWRAAGCPEPTLTENPFKDVNPKAFYYKAVLWAVEMGITSGVDATHFAPDQGCTRGQVVTFLWRACGKPEPSSAHNPFVDVNPNAYYYKAVLWASEYGITSGTSATRFSPNQVCTRGQIVTFLYRTFG